MKSELLAPAGSLEKMKYAFLFGADAVYMGGKNFSLRANAKNFSLEEMKEAVEYAHFLGKKVYVTCNIVFHNEDLEGLKEYLHYLESIHVDAILASDISVMQLLKDEHINVPLHIRHFETRALPQAFLYGRGMREVHLGIRNGRVCQGG